MGTQTLEREPVRPGAHYRWTRAQYEHMIAAGILTEDDRVELIDGAIIEMSPQGSRHFALIRLTAEALEACYDEGYDIRQQGPLALGDDSEPEPNVAVVRGQPRDYLDTHPTTALLVVEVADTSLLKDRIDKAVLYAHHGIPEYWILNIAEETLEVHRDPAAGAYQTKTTLRCGDTVSPPETQATVDVADLLP